MAKYLWKFLDNMNMQRQWEVKLFLLLHVLVLTAIAFAIELIFCSVLGAAFIDQHSATLFVLPLYVGLFVGLYGGLVFLMRQARF